MTTSEVMDALRGFVRSTFNVPPNDPDFSDDIHLFDYGYVDSFGAVQLTSFVGETFGTEVRQTDLIAFPMNTIREIATFVVRRRAGEI
jgi:acyl carrier protein